METLKFEDIKTNKLIALIESRLPFEVIGLGDVMSEAVSIIEKAIEEAGMSCRIYTKGRIAAAGASVVGGVTGVLVVASAVAIAAHNLATWDPDYEIAKHVVDNKVSVSFMK